MLRWKIQLDAGEVENWGITQVWNELILCNLYAALDVIYFHQTPKDTDALYMEDIELTSKSIYMLSGDATYTRQLNSNNKIKFQLLGR